MDIPFEQKKINLIQWLSTLDDADILEKIAQLRKEDQTDWWDTLSDPEKDSIRKGLADADAGRMKPHSEARKLYERWL